MKNQNLHRKVVIPLALVGIGVEESMYKFFLLEIEWNVHIYTEDLCSPNHTLLAGNGVGINFQKNIILLEIKWHIQICTEKSCIPSVSSHVIGVEVERVNLQIFLLGIE